MATRFLLIIIPAILYSCTVSNDISSRNLATLYREPESVFEPEFAVHQQLDSTSLVYIRLKPGNMLYMNDGHDSYESVLRVRMYLMASYENSAVLDSGVYSFKFDLNQKQNIQVLECRFRPSHVGVQLLHIYLNDINKNLEEDYFIPFDNLADNHRQYYRASDSKGEILFTDHISATDSVHVSYARTSEKKLWCSFYHRDFPLPPPPFSFDNREGFVYTPDSLFEVSTQKDSLYVFPPEGFYHFRTDTMSHEGLTLFRFSPGFPDVSNAREMLESVRYILTRREYDMLLSSGNVKQTMDAFWLEKGKNPERTRTLIRKYYGRVQRANRLFSSYTEGWRTDRGMIYIIFGPPNSIYRSSVSESWIYGTANSVMSLNFFFTKVMNPFTDNDYSLTRTPVYESAWYRAVDSWRQGRPYNGMY